MHIIQRQKFILKLAHKAQAKRVQEKISRLAKERLNVLMDELFTEFFAKEIIIKIDKLVLDLGIISEQNIEREIEAALRAQLPTILSKLSAQERAEIKQISKKKSKLELLDFYLSRGYFPWWVHEKQGFDLEGLVQELLQKNPEAIKSLLINHLEQETVRQRLAYQLSEKTLQNLRRVIIGSSALEYEWFLNQLNQLHQHAKIREISRRAYRRYMEDILQVYIVRSTKMETSPTDFSIYFLEKVIQKFNVSAKEIHQYYQRKIPKNSAGEAEKNWLETLDNWVQERQGGTKANMLSQVDLVIYFLKTGLLPNTGLALTVRDIDEIITALIAAKNPIWFRQFKALLSTPEVQIRLVEQLAPETLFSLQQLLFSKADLRVIRRLFSEIEPIGLLPNAPTVLKKQLFTFYQIALLQFFTIFKGQEDFIQRFLPFFSHFLAKKVPLNWEKWWQQLDTSSQQKIQEQIVLQILFFADSHKNTFVGDLFLPYADLLEVIDDLLIGSNSRNFLNTELRKSGRGFSSIKEATMVKTKLGELIKTTTFFEDHIEALTLTEVANLAKIILTPDYHIYKKAVKGVARFLLEKPLPQRKQRSQLSTEKYLWLSLMKADLNKNYHGKRSQHFWENWINALAVLMGISATDLWMHFQQMPLAISQTLPNFKSLIQKNERAGSINTKQQTHLTSKIKQLLHDEKSLKEAIQQGGFIQQLAIHTKKFSAIDWEQLIEQLKQIESTQPDFIAKNLMSSLQKFNNFLSFDYPIQFIQLLKEQIKVNPAKTDAIYVAAIRSVLKDVGSHIGLNQTSINLTLEKAILNYWVKDYSVMFDPMHFMERIIAYFEKAIALKPSELLWLITKRKETWDHQPGKEFNTLKALIKTKKTAVQSVEFTIREKSKEPSKLLKQFIEAQSLSKKAKSLNPQDEDFSIIAALFFQQKKLAPSWTSVNFESQLIHFIQQKDKLVTAIIWEAISHLDSLMMFRNLSTQTIHLVQNKCFPKHHHWLEEHFEGFQKIATKSSLLPRLSTNRIASDIRIALMFVLRKSNTEQPVIDLWMNDFLMVISIFHKVDKASLKSDFAVITQQANFKISSAIHDYFRTITAPQQSMDREQSFFYFLKTGSFPTHSSFQTLAALEQWLSDSETPKQPAFQKQLLILLSDRHIKKRVFEQLSITSIRLFNQYLAGEAIAAYEMTLLEYEKFFQSQDYPNAIKRRLPETLQTGLLIYLIANAGQNFAANQLFQTLTRHIAAVFQQKSIHQEETKVHNSTQNGEERRKLLFPKNQEQQIEIAKSILAFLHDEPRSEHFIFQNIIEVEESLQFALEHYPEVIFQTWQQSNRISQSITILVQQISTPIIELMIDQLSGIAEQTIWKEIQSFRFKLADLPNHGLIALSFFQNLVLRNILVHKEDAAAFAKTIWRQMAIKYKQSLTDFLIGTASIIPTSGAIHLAFISLVNQIKQATLEQYLAENATPAAKKIQETKRLAAALVGIIDYLKHGTFTQENPIQSPKKMESVILNLLKKQPQNLIKAFYDLPQFEQIFTRIRDSFSTATLTKLILLFSEENKVAVPQLLNIWQQIPWQNLIPKLPIKSTSVKENQLIAIRVLINRRMPLEASFLEALFKQTAQLNQQSEWIFLRTVYQPVLRQIHSAVFQQQWLHLAATSKLNYGLKLEEHITQTVNKASVVAASSSLYAYDQQLISSFIETGKLPWWVNGEPVQQLAQSLINLSQKQPANLKKLLQKSWRSPQQQRRLLDIVKIKTWRQVIKNIIGNYALLVEVFQGFLQQNLSAKENIPVETLNHNIWKITLHHIWHTPPFSSEVFVKHTITLLSESLKMDLDIWLPSLKETIEMNRKNGAIDGSRILTILNDWSLISLEKIDQTIEEEKTSSTAITHKSINNEVGQISTSIQKREDALFALLENIRFFFEYGTPRDPAIFSHKKTLLAAFEQKLRRQPQFLRPILIPLMRNQEAILRIQSILPPKLIWQVIRVLYDKKAGIIALYWKDLMHVLPGIVRKYNQQVLENFLHYQALTYFPNAQTGLFNIRDFLILLLRQLGKKENINPLTILHKIKETTQAQPNILKGRWDQLIPKIYKQLEEHLEKGQQRIKWDLEATNEDLKKEMLYVSNAGLSVVAPFLTRYFTMLEMLDEDKQFHDEATTIRAVHLIQYIATGKTETPEPDLVFNKILCGLPLATPVPKGIELTDHEATITSQMLSAILQHWKGLGTTTIDGLRGGFLIRDGRLEWHPDGYWNLDVEKKSYDILIQSLPWSISMIQFSWITYRIQVTWN